MTPHEINQKIAEFCNVPSITVGWYLHHPTEDSIILQTTYAHECVEYLKGLPDDSPYKNYEVRADQRYPEYYGDLNAMNEAEEWLLKTKGAPIFGLYVYNLGKAMEPGRFTISAKASQRAQTFIETIKSL